MSPIHESGRAIHPCTYGAFRTPAAGGARQGLGRVDRHQLPARLVWGGHDRRQGRWQGRVDGRPHPRRGYPVGAAAQACLHLERLHARTGGVRLSRVLSHARARRRESRADPPSGAGRVREAERHGLAHLPRHGRGCSARRNCRVARDLHDAKRRRYGAVPTRTSGVIRTGIVEVGSCVSSRIRLLPPSTREPTC